MRTIPPNAIWARIGSPVSVSHSDDRPTVIADDTSSSATYPSLAFTDISPCESLRIAAIDSICVVMIHLL